MSLQINKKRIIREFSVGHSGISRITGDRDAYFWATHGGAELDLMLPWHGQRIGFEFKFSDAPGLTKSMHVAVADLTSDGHAAVATQAAIQRR